MSVVFMQLTKNKMVEICRKLILENEIPMNFVFENLWDVRPNSVTHTDVHHTYPSAEMF